MSFDGDGSGAVVSSFGKRCSAACEVPPSTLTAEADEFSAFDGWSGNGCSGIGECPVSYGSVTASFRAVAYPIVVRVTGKGSVERDGQPVPVGQALRVARDASLTLTAKPAEGWLLARWQGACEPGSDRLTCLVRPTARGEAVAVFEKVTLMTVTVDGPGAVEGPASVGVCATTCTGVERAGSTARFTARPSPDAMFVRWLNGCGAENPCTITLQQSLTLTAIFKPAIVLRSTGDGQGGAAGVASTNCETLPCSIPWTGETLAFDAAPGEGSNFTSFRNCPRPSDDMCTIDRYVPSIEVGFERIVSEVIELSGGVQDIRRDVSASGGVDYSWVQHDSPVVALDASTPATGFSLLQVRGGRPSWLVHVSDESVVASSARPDGGIALLVSALTSVSIAGVTVPAGQDAVVALNVDGQLEWVARIANADTSLHSVKVSSTNGDVWVGGRIEPGGPSLTVGTSSVTPPAVGPDAEALVFLASYSPSGAPQWVRRVADEGTVQVFQGPVGPFALATAKGSNGCASAGRATFTDALFMMHFLADGGCPIGADSEVNAPGFAPFDAVALPGESLVAAYGVPYWLEAITTPSSFMQRVSVTAGAPVLPRRITCGVDANFRLRSMGGVRGTEVLLTGHGDCVPDSTVDAGAQRAFASTWDFQRFSARRSWVFPVQSQVVAANTVSPGEAVAWVSTEQPFRLNNRDYRPDAGSKAFYRLRLKP